AMPATAREVVEGAASPPERARLEAAKLCRAFRMILTEGRRRSPLVLAIGASVCCYAGRSRSELVVPPPGSPVRVRHVRPPPTSPPCVTRAGALTGTPARR